MNQYRRTVFTLTLSGLFLLGLFLLLTETPQTAQADPVDLFVTPHGGGDCSRAAPCALQMALEAASEGDTIYVAQGTYTGSESEVVSLTESVTLYGGWDGAATGAVVRDPDIHRTVLDGEGQRRVVAIRGPVAPTLDGFTITGGNASRGPDAGRGGGVYSTQAAPIITGNVITNNMAYTSASTWGYGGGIYVSDSPGGAVIRANRVLSNVAGAAYTGYGGGICLREALSARVVDNVVMDNAASLQGLGYGGGIQLSEAHSSLVADNVVQDNVATASGEGFGGGIKLSDAHSVRVVGNVVQRNVAGLTGPSRGGGLDAFGARSATIAANRVLSNASVSGGGLSFSRHASFTMTNNLVAANYASERGGGMAFSTGPSSPVTGTLAHNTFAANDRGSGRGRVAIYVRFNVTLVLTNNLVVSHTQGLYASGACSVSLYNTLFYANSDGDLGGPGAVVNVDAVTGQDPRLDAEYHLRRGSPAIDAGAPLPWVRTDLEGDARPWGDGYDIGADERTGSCIYLPLVVRQGFIILKGKKVTGTSPQPGPAALTFASLAKKITPCTQR